MSGNIILRFARDNNLLVIIASIMISTSYPVAFFIPHHQLPSRIRFCLIYASRTSYPLFTTLVCPICRQQPTCSVFYGNTCFYLSDNACYRMEQTAAIRKNRKQIGKCHRKKVSVSAILSCRPFFILIFLPCIKMNHYGFSRKSIWKNLETFP